MSFPTCLSALIFILIVQSWVPLSLVDQKQCRQSRSLHKQRSRKILLLWKVDTFPRGFRERGCIPLRPSIRRHAQSGTIHSSVRRQQHVANELCQISHNNNSSNNIFDIFAFCFLLLETAGLTFPARSTLIDMRALANWFPPV